MTRLAAVINKIIDKIENLGTTKQEKLVSETNIKSLNGESLLGSGNSTTIGTGTLTTTSQNVIGAINEHESGKATKAELTTAQATLNGRIDNIIAGGTAPSEAEIVDARQGADGINYASLGGAIRGQVSVVKSAFNSAIHYEELEEVNSNYLGWTLHENKSCNTSGLIDSDVFDSEDILITELSEIYMKSYDGSQIIICVFPDGTIGGTGGYRFRSVDGNLPTQSNKASISANSRIVVSYPKNSVFSIAGSIYVNKKILDEDVKVKYANLDSPLQQILDDANNVTNILDDISQHKLIKEIDETYAGWTLEQSKSCSKSGYAETDAFDSVQMILTSEQHIYMKSYDGSQIIICAFPNGVIPTAYDSSAIRYRSIDNNLPTENNKATIPSGSMLVVSYPKNSTFILGINLVAEGYELKDGIVTYDSLSNDLRGLFAGGTIITVGTGKMYNTIKAAIDACVNPSPTNKYIIEFYGNGTEYDLTSETTAWNTEHPDEPIGLKLPDYTLFRGVGGKDKCILALRLNAQSTVISPLNIKGTTSLEGLTVIGENTRYTIHDDYETLGSEIHKERHISNCDFIGKTLAYAATWGAGFRSGNVWHFKNCRFISQSSGGFPFTCHNNKHFVEPARLYFKNCRCVHPNNNKGFAFGSINTDANGIINELYFYGNQMLYLELMEQAVATYGAGNLMKVSGYGNDIGNSDVIISVTDGIDYSSYVDLIGKYSD